MVHCAGMLKDGTPGTVIEIQGISDIFFSCIEIYTVASSSVPFKIIRPHRLMHESDAYKRIALWHKNKRYCLAMVHSSSSVPPNAVSVNQEVNFEEVFHKTT